MVRSNSRCLQSIAFFSTKTRDTKSAIVVYRKEVIDMNLSYIHIVKHLYMNNQ